MLREMSGVQFQEWRAYYDLEPFGENREDWRNAHIVQTLLSVFRAKGKQPPPLKDCKLTFGTEPAKKQKTVEQRRAEIMATMTLLAAVQNAPEQQRKRLRRAG